MSQKSTGFVSEIDQFLEEFDKKHPELSASQRKELAKAQQIALLRDRANMTATKVKVPQAPIYDWFNKNE